jgi:addiction module RelB/DinJ family antitoxin
MTEMLRVRVERKLRREAEKVCNDMGTASGDVIQMVFRQLVKRRAIPFPIQAETAEDEVTGPVQRRAAIMDQSN